VKPCTARRHKPVTQFWIFLNELPSDDEYPPSDASRIGSVLVFWDFWVHSDWEKEKFQVIISD